MEWNYTPQVAGEQSNSAQSFVSKSGAEATREGYALEEEDDCWAVASVECLQAVVNMNTGIQLLFSPQHIVDYALGFMCA
ncbi:hypothetical protein DVH24_016720 [Malus domestica]|uniref:Uncharacterized protein n=1 Tax=Malus domestica TaxID=3750 RepID=A0A498HQS6_MALDO|nr:hypothetical protein DVH24_016720 [Malus domestica]